MTDQIRLAADEHQALLLRTQGTDHALLTTWADGDCVLVPGEGNRWAFEALAQIRAT